MIREITIIKLKAEILEEAIQLFENYAAFKRTRPGCRTAGVNKMVSDPSLPYLDHQSFLLYAEYDNLKCLAECTHALQEHFHLHKLPFQEFMIGPPIYGIFEA
ncbi:hypothetical protein JW933_09080 [candidate division FCPU426 bacterium]|nr:hypothetical protein [candidate division FCPU426 bacterium]